MVIGITGSIGTGKSTVSNIIKSHGYIVVDADQLSHDALNKGTPTYDTIVSNFDCLDEQKEINRKKLGEIVFNDEKKRKQLESIIHPYVLECIKETINEHDLIFLDVPLLFESHMDQLCDKVLLVSCEKSTQINRIISRDHCTKEEALKRINVQMPLSEKKLKSNYIIENNDDLSSLEEKVERFLNNEVLHI